MAITDQFVDFFASALTDALTGAFQNAVGVAAVGNALKPLIEQGLSAIPPDDLKIFQSVSQSISSALKGDLSVPSTVAAAISQIPGVTASASGDVIDIRVTGQDVESGIALAGGSFHVGSGTFGVDASADLTGNLTTTADIHLTFDTKSGEVKLIDDGVDQLQVQFDVVASDLDATAKLGLVGADVAQATPNETVLHVDTGIKMTAAGDASFELNQLKADLDLTLHTISPLDPSGESLLPSLYADVEASWTSAGFGGGLTANAAVTVVTASSASAANGPAGGYFILDNTGANQGTLYWEPIRTSFNLRAPERSFPIRCQHCQTHERQQ